MITKSLTVSAVSLGLAASYAGAGAWAQEPSYVIEEITVTARKREENLQDVPAAVSAFGAQQLQDAGIDNIKDIANITPNMTMNETSGLNPGSIQVFIRGIGNDAGFDQGVGIYVDDVYLNRVNGSLIDVFDIERIEVLKGPQGNLYGRNTIGGAVKYVSARPTDETKANFELKTGTDSLVKFRAGVSGGLSDNVFAGFAASYSKRDGYQTNAFDGQDFAGEDKTALRGTLIWDASDTFSLKLVGDYSKDDSPPAVPKRVAIADFVPGAIFLVEGADVIIPGSALFPLGSTDISLDPDVDTVNTAHLASGFDRFEIETTGIALTATWDLSDAWTVKSISAFRTLDNVLPFDLDGSAQLFIDVIDDRESDDLSQELQFNYTGDTVNGVFGLYYLDGDFSGAPHFADQSARLRLFTSHQRARSLDDRTLESISAYGNFDWNINDDWQLSLGGRYTRDEKTVAQSSEVTVTHHIGVITNLPGLAGIPLMINPAFAPFYSPQPFFVAFLPHFSDENGSFLGFGDTVTTEVYTQTKSGSDDWSEFSPSVKLSFWPNDDVLLYGGVATGFKSGGFDTSGSETVVVSYEPETVTTYSLGLKSTLGGGSVRLNAEVFQNDYQEKQLQTIVLIGGALESFTDNVGEVTSTGAEVELTWLPPVEGLTLNLNVGWLDSDIDQFLEAQAGGGFANVADNFVLGYSPELTVQGRFQYDFNVGDGYMTVGASAAYTSEMYTDSPIDLTDPFLANALSPSRTIWNAQIAYRSANDHWRVALDGKNLGDERSLVNTFNVQTLMTGGFMRGRTWGLTVSYDYF